jgi:uncharacterized SAM-binding protein YcdF (DUF218 family)
MLPRRRVDWWRLGWLIAFAMAATWVASLIAVIVFEHRDDARPAAAIVVLGAAQYVGHPSPVLRARVDHAIDLWRAHLAPTLIFTGGPGEHDTTSEAAVAQRYAIARGVPPRVIMIENVGRSTEQSLQQVAILMNMQPSRTVILVSDPFHMLRLFILARHHGLVPYTSPTRTSPISQSWREAWKYRLAESIKAPVSFVLERRE